LKSLFPHTIPHKPDKNQGKKKNLMKQMNPETSNPQGKAQNGNIRPLSCLLFVFGVILMIIMILPI